jgi:PAS domain S-box-containing protein
MPDEELDIHPLLRRQLRRAGIAEPDSPPTDPQPWRALLGRVGRTYESADRDRYLLERSLDVSSAEMQELHSQLAEDKEILDSVLGALSSGICHLDPDWTIRFVNAAARRQLRLFGEDVRRAFEDFSFRTTYGDRLDPERITRILRGGRPLVEQDVVVVRSDRTTFPASVTFNPMIRNDALTGIVVSIIDITERKQAQEQIEEARVEAAAAERARQAQAAFLANMSHELRTPLNAIMGYSELIIEDADELGYDELSPDLQKIRTAGRHLLSLINDVLDMSKIQAGRLDLDVDVVDVADLLTEVADTIAPTIRKNNNALEVEVADDVPTLRTDRLRLYQALLNVAGNAGKFTSDGRVMLRAAAREDAVSIEIEDTGIGMTPETVEKLFEPFTQADTSTTRRFGGTGLGLAITQSICTPLGIELEVETAPGEGSTFRFRVPVEFEPSATTTQPPPRKGRVFSDRNRGDAARDDISSP